MSTSILDATRYEAGTSNANIYVFVDGFDVDGSPRISGGATPILDAPNRRFDLLGAQTGQLRRGARGPGSRGPPLRGGHSGFGTRDPTHRPF